MYERPRLTKLGLLGELSGAKPGSGNDGNVKLVGMAPIFDVVGKSDDN